MGGDRLRCLENGRSGCLERFFSAATAAVVLLAVLPALVVTAPTASADTQESSSASEASTALERAAASGEEVEVVGERAEYSTTYANPDGYSFTLEQSVVPVRVATKDGSWAAPDATLERRADGSIGPKAAVADISFSAGGDGDGLVTLAEDGKSLSLGWPGTLPKPTLDGAAVTYADVLPGVDLRLTATVEGVKQVLIVKSAEAAANPDLERIEFSLETEGLAVSSRTGGGLAAVDEDGNTVFRSPAARMWDSAGDVGTGGTTTMSLASASDDEPVQDGDGEASPDHPADGPGVGDASAVLPVQLTEESVAVVPDPELLAGEDTVYPLYIDPDVALEESERTVLSSDGDTYYNFSGGDDGEGVGYCGTYVTGGYAYYCGSGYKQRMYFEFAPTKLAGKRVLDTTFRVTERWSMSCEKTVVELVRTGNISSATNWPGPTSNWDVMGDRTVAAGRGSLCDPDQPDAPIEFNDDPAQSYENLTSTVKKFAAGDFSRLTLMLKADDESDPNGWKRFDDDAVLSVKYVGLPAVPTSAGIVRGSGISCETDAGDPDIIADPTPMLTARPQTAAGGESGAHLRAHFFVQRKQSDGSWDVATEPVRPTSGSVGDNVAVTYPSPITLSEGALYRLRVHTRSLYNDDASYLESNSTVTTKGWCYFKVDTTAPKAPKISFGSPYSECTADACAAAGGPGTKAQFTFSPAAGDTTNTHYQYKLATDKTWSTAIVGETVKPWITPRLAGLQQLQVRAKDVNGWGGKAIVEFKVAEGQTAVGRWHFDDAAAGSAVTTAADTATEGARHPATLYTTGAGWSSLARRGDGDRSLWLNDTSDTTRQSGYAATTESVVNTQSSFTVGAWAYLTDSSAYRTVLSQTGSDSSSFSLYYSSGAQRWVFLWSWYENGVRKYQGANADAAGVALKTWTHVAGSYDAENRTIRLYVNGRLQGGPVSLPATSDATVSDGALQIGRVAYTAGTYQNYWRGRVDEVAVWQRLLTDDEVATEARLLDADGNADVELVGAWDPDGASGTTLSDTASGYGRSLTLTGGATLDGEAIVLDGTDDAATTAGPVIDESGSFTVTAAVELDSAAMGAKADGYVAQVVGQRGTDGASWGLWFEKTGTEFDPETETELPVGKWYFGRLNADGSWTAVVSDEAAVVSGNSVTQLTGVFDAYTDTIGLYIGANQNGSDLAYTAVAGSADFAVGKGFVDSAWAHYLAGRVTDVRIWAGAMSGQQQISDTVGIAGA
ncbi:LamG domain-containing protein [Streptomyces sp. CA-210063]|uniref:LamG domain-containing protein n=1 Tax=Streptomyces sp. CA-210063 TaxID=2801029 RepID=UPI00214BF83E|nr:LamG domain-containing protein [Streptomyces sp. CA-210063]UUU31893.1 LamG domain-containing protein [Streptomyces sp. CA-210063]